MEKNGPVSSISRKMTSPRSYRMKSTVSLLEILFSSNRESRSVINVIKNPPRPMVVFTLVSEVIRDYLFIAFIDKGVELTLDGGSDFFGKFVVDHGVQSSALRSLWIVLLSDFSPRLETNAMTYEAANTKRHTPTTLSMTIISVSPFQLSLIPRF